ncbi:CDP-alcohol phosphatidyltransferase family protein [uncultured Cardiobacterium sp.]|uniref:CDP-alcohol phosphatidyltransferase family protein n=1 Tax=uncultured Cardiobacterium sp. TaxID=417619 RepID=UPI00345722D8
MSIYALKPKFQNLLRPLVRRLHARGTTANQVTVFACAISIALGITLACFPTHAALFLLLPLWFFLRMALNAMDGMLAREFGQRTALGGYLNEITDVVADAALYLPFAFVAPFDALSVGVFIYLAALTEFCGVLGAVHGNGRRYDGPLGKSDRAFAIGCIAFYYALAGSLPDWLNTTLWLLNILLAATCVRRIRNGLNRRIP